MADYTEAGLGYRAEYMYDTIQRLYDGQFGEEGVNDISRYIKLGKLGEAFDSEEQVVLLIDEIDKAESERRIEKLKDIYNTDKVFNCADFVKDSTSVADMIKSVKNMVLIITLIIVVLIAVLMERSFIAKERSEIALLKAIGFRNRSIVMWHSLRFVIVSVISTIISLATLIPLTQFAVGPVFSMMGANYGMEYAIDPIQVFVVYPLIVMATTLVSAMLTALHTRTIKSSEVSGVE
mgnify:CR=1 FL=1